MELRLFEFSDYKLLDPNISSNDEYYKDGIDYYTKELLNLSPASQTSTIQVSTTKLDHIASLHCDKWLEETARHMTVYAGAYERPELSSPIGEIALKKFPWAKYRSFSGDVSGVIGEALFALVLIEYFGLAETDFVHFGASKSTGVFPDFGIHKVSERLRIAFRHAFACSGAMDFDIDLNQVHLLPAEVKAMTNPSYTIMKSRLDKACQQLRNFWKTRKVESVKGQLLERGASMVFMALRNPRQAAYDGVIIWLT